MTPAIAPDALTTLMQGSRPHAVLDVRERGAYERGHIFRTTSLPRRLLETRLGALVTASTTPLVLVDEDGGALARLAAATVAAMGFTDVRTLAGGVTGWRQGGRPVAQGLNVPSKVFGERMLHERRTPQITPHDLRRRIDAGEDLVIVDSRTPEEYARGCVPGAVSVPGGELVLRITDLVRRPETTIVVHCGGRTRSYIGAESLRWMGLPNAVVALENGTMGWTLAGLELERNARRVPPPPSAQSRAAATLVAKRVATESGLRFVGPAELQALWARRDRENLSVLDVRTAEEYAAGHVAGALWAPGGQLVQATDEYVAVAHAAIVLVCDGLVRSALTAAWLTTMGFPGVAVLAGGLPAWEREGGAVERGQPALAPWGLGAARAAVQPILPGDLGDALVLCVDPSDMYARGHVPGARWVCRSRLELRIDELAPDRDRPIVVTCADGVSATLAAAALARLGYRDVRPLEGGLAAWEAAGRPVERGATGLADEPDDVVLKPYDRGRSAMEAYLRWEEALDMEGVSPHRLL